MEKTIITDYNTFIKERYNRSINESFEADNIENDNTENTEDLTDDNLNNEEQSDFDYISKEELIKKAEESEEPIIIVTITEDELDEFINEVDDEIKDRFEIFKFGEPTENEEEAKTENDLMADNIEDSNEELEYSKTIQSRYGANESDFNNED